MLGGLRCCTTRKLTLYRAQRRYNKNCPKVQSTFGQKLAEPVSLSSTLPTNFGLPPTVARLGFDLLALRARRNRDTREAAWPFQDLSDRRRRNLQKIQFSTFSTPAGPCCGQSWGGEEPFLSICCNLT